MKKRILYNIPSMISLIIIIISITAIIFFGVFSTKYMVLIIAAEVLLYLLSIILYNLKNKILKIIGIFLMIIQILGNCIAYYYVNNTDQYYQQIS